MRPNGTGHRIVEPRGLTGFTSGVSGAAWSPRGDEIVLGRTFATDECPEHEVTHTFGGCSRGELVVMNRDGSNARSIYRPPQVDDGAVGEIPRSSPLSKLPSVTFSAFGWDGSRVFMIIHEEIDPTPPAECPRNRPCGNGSDVKRTTRVAAVNADGTGFRYLTGDGTFELGGITLSPDGRQIAMLHDGSLAVMSSSGGPIRRVRIRQPLASKTCTSPTKTRCVEPRKLDDASRPHAIAW